jgi:hypothetical protein
MEVPHFDGIDFVSWKSQMSSYLREVEIGYGWPERANLLWKVLEQMYGSSNSKKSSSSDLKNISSSSILFYQSQKEKSSSQKEEAKSDSLGRPDCLVSQTGLSNFGKIETS